MLGKQFPATLISAGLRVERHDDHFDHRTPDEEWLKEVGQRGWIAITRDRRIRYKRNQRDAIIENGAGVLMLLGNATFPELATSFLATRKQIERFIAQHEPPYIAKIYRPPAHDNPLAPGRIELWYPR